MTSRAVKLVVLALAGLLGLILVPVLYQLIVGSFTNVDLISGSRTWTTEYYAEIFASGGTLRAAVNTVIFAAGSAVVAISIGGIQAWLAERTNAPLRRLAYVSTVILIGAPYLVYTIAWMLILGRNGIVNGALARILDSTNPTILNGNSLGGMILVEGLVWSPLAFLLIVTAFMQANPVYEEAARMSGASTFTIMRRITFPLAWPAILAVGLLAFVRVVEAFEVPAVVGSPGGVEVLTTQVYNALQRGTTPNYGFANALSVVLALVVGVLLWRYNKLSKKADRYQVVSGEAYKPGVLDLGPWKWAGTAVSVLMFSAIVVLPFAVLTWVSLVPVYRGLNTPLLDFTLSNFTKAFESPTLMEGATNTVIVCVIAAIAANALTLLVAWFVVRRAPGSAIIDQLVSVPMIIPGIVVGIAIAQVGLASPVPVYGTIWILMFGYFVSFLPFTMRFAYAGIIQVREDLEESALMSGAGRLRIFVRIVLPLMRTSLLMGGVFAFMQGARALSMPIFLASPDNPVAAVSLYDAYVNGSTTQVAAFGVAWTCVMVAIAAGIFALSKRANVAVF